MDTILIFLIFISSTHLISSADVQSEDAAQIHIDNSNNIIDTHNTEEGLGGGTVTEQLQTTVPEHTGAPNHDSSLEQVHVAESVNNELDEKQTFGDQSASSDIRETVDNPRDDDQDESSIISNEHLIKEPTNNTGHENSEGQANDDNSNGENKKTEVIKETVDEEKDAKEMTADEKPEEEVDDIVTFEEFKSKRNQEVVNSKPSQSVLPVPARQAPYRNYALADCGAKVLETNKEAKNAGSILLENKDLYMLNPCSANIWFVIELCELVSVSVLEIGCFELFSSTPKTIAVFTSDSYPDPTWEKLGNFSFSEERGIHKFPLVESVYTKYIKFEMLKYFGTEHYCPISTVKVLGSTMIKEYEFSESQRDSKNGIHLKNEDESKKIIQNEDGT